MTQKSIKDLAFSYRSQPTLCVMGENLPRGRYLWKLYGFLSQFVIAKNKIADTDTDISLSVAYVVDEMLYDINKELENYSLQLVESGGNLYLQSSIS